MKKILKIAAIVIGALILGVIIAVPCVWMGEIKTINTIEQPDENNPYLYTMEYKADYDLDEVIAANLDSNMEIIKYVVRKISKGLPVKLKISVENKGAGCTSFQAKNSEGEGWLFGRNYDFFKNPTLVTYSRPKNGYASIGVSDMSHFGYNLDKLPDSFKKKAMCLASIYAPVDGINEKGLCTSIMALPGQASRQDTEKNVVGTTVIMRLFLDRCATVQEALSLLSTLDVRHDAENGTGYHYMVADASGDCAIIEFDKDDGWKTLILRKRYGANSMHITNHLLADKFYTAIPDPSVGNVQSRSWWRYEVVSKYLEERNGVLSLDEAQECLALVFWRDLKWDNGLVEDTQYSNVYDQSTRTLYLKSWFDEYGKTHTFSLK